MKIERQVTLNIVVDIDNECDLQAQMILDDIIGEALESFEDHICNDRDVLEFDMKEESFWQGV